jgi:hypothetical protein
LNLLNVFVVRSTGVVVASGGRTNSLNRPGVFEDPWYVPSRLFVLRLFGAQGDRQTLCFDQLIRFGCAGTHGSNTNEMVSLFHPAISLCDSSLTF